MAYDLKTVTLPVAQGPTLKVGARLLELPGISAPLVAKLMTDSNMLLARSSPVHEAPVMAPLWPKSAASAFDAAFLQEESGKVAPLPARRARDFAQAYRNGMSPETVAKRVLAAMETHKALHAFIAVDHDDVRAQAMASAARWRAGKPLSLLDGVPVAVKDEVDQTPYNTTGGTRFLGRAPAAADATVVQRLRALGALLIGKANMHEIGIQPNGMNAHYGTARNPYDPAHDPGGSSSGSAVAVALGLCPIAIGADGGGSIRVPAGHCGVVGLKATFGRVSERGAVPLCWTVGHLGPITNSVEDAALAYAAIAGPDALDPMSQQQPGVSLQDWNGSVRGLRLGVYKEWNEHADPEVVAACHAVIQGLQAQGAIVHAIEIPELEALRVAHAITILSEMATSMRAEAPGWDVFADSVRITLCAARALTATDYVWAQRVRARAMAQWGQVFSQVDAVITPTSATPSPRYPTSGDYSDLSTTLKVMRYAFPGNHLGLPSIAFPAGYTAAGLPISVQATGRAWDEHVLLRIANCAESFVERRLPRAVVDLLAG